MSKNVKIQEKEKVASSSKKVALIFDLDDTLIVDTAVSMEALQECAHLALKRHGADAEQFARDASRFAQTFWKAGSCQAYCHAIGISAFECLWGDFKGTHDDLRELREWSQLFRVQVFDRALREQMIKNQEGAHELSSIFAAARRRLQRLMPMAQDTLMRLSSTYQLALLTNGASDLQREKIKANGLERIFQAVAISGEYGIGKPQAKIFHHLAAELGAKPSEAIMVGNSLERDIAGARNAGMTSVWIQVSGSEEHAEVKPDFTVQNLDELPAILETL